MTNRNQEYDHLPKEHPTYGMISIHRTNCHPATNLVGSDLKHNSFISLKISDSSYHRTLNSDTWFEGGKLIEVHLSFTQWAELLTSMNSTGVPCTLDWIRGQGSIDDPIPFVDKSALHKREFDSHFKETVETVADLVSKLEVEIEEKAGKKQMRETVHDLKCKIRNLRANQDFAINQFNEAVEDTMNRAKGEAKAFLTSIGFDLSNQKQIGLPFSSEIFDESKLIEIKED